MDAEEVLRSRNAQQTAVAKAEDETRKARQLLEDADAAEKFAAAIASATARLEATGFEGGKLRQMWEGGSLTTEVAAWYLPTSSTSMYWFILTLQVVLTNPVGSSEANRHHNRDVTMKRLEPDYHHAIASGWLLRMHTLLSTSELKYLTKALDKLPWNM